MTARSEYFRDRVLSAKQLDALRHWQRQPLRPIRFDGEAAFISLTNGAEAIVDRDDLPLVESRRWHRLRRRTTSYAGSLCLEALSRGEKLIVALHNVLLNPPAGMVVDHIDCDGLNCRRANLRLATFSQNTANARRRSDNTSGFKGVALSGPSGRWRAYIRPAGKQIHLGIFDTPEEAHAAYAAAAQRLFGAFARPA